MSLDALFSSMQLKVSLSTGEDIVITSPIDGSVLANLASDQAEDIDRKITRSALAFKEWKSVPAPQRGELIRKLGEKLRHNKNALGKLVSIECGKILSEGLGEVQEMIDICDFAVGLSRQIGGLTLPSERPEHCMHENWLPLGPVGVISAFNFPVAVWSWNFTLAIVCGDSVLWKPSEKSALTALACQGLFQQVLKESDFRVPEGLLELLIGGVAVGDKLVKDPRVPLISATGSCRMGREVAPEVAKRFGRCLLELGGNNAAIVTPSADLDIVLPSVLFGAVGTAGQRCTSTRRLFVHRSLFDTFHERLLKAYENVSKRIGSPLESETLIGPLIDERAFLQMQSSLKTASALPGAQIYGGERTLKDRFPDAYYVKPALVKLAKQDEIVMEETFAPILYMMPYDTVEEALEMNNAVKQGLSSAIFTNDIKEAEQFKLVSDCGISNVNIGTSGAEIGGAFGGEKETGGGRESGSDAWKVYMRRQTSTTYYGKTPPALAQGVRFD
jgi:aldehyde dehydrogenase (NAD+)